MEMSCSTESIARILISLLVFPVVQVVFRDNGYRHCVHSAPQLALQRTLALLDQRRHLCIKCPFVLCFPHHLSITSRHLSRDMDRNDQTPSTITLYWHIPHGPSDHYQYDSLCVRSGLGRQNHLPGTFPFNWTSHMLTSGQAWTLWWIDAVIAISTCFRLPFVM